MGRGKKFWVFLEQGWVTGPLGRNEGWATEHIQSYLLPIVDKQTSVRKLGTGDRMVWWRNYLGQSKKA